MGFKEAHKENQGSTLGKQTFLHDTTHNLLFYFLTMFWLELIIFLEVWSIPSLMRKKDPHILEF